MNRTIVTVLVVGCAACVGIVYCADKAPEGGTKAPAALPAIDASKGPNDWRESVNEAQKVLDGMAADLIAIAKDEKRPAEDRIAAIHLLGKIGNWRALQFLVSNVSLRIEPSYGGLDHRRAWQWPCRQTLVELGLPGAETIFKALQRTEVSAEDMEHLAFALRGIFGTAKAAEAVVYEKVRHVNAGAAKRIQQAIDKLDEKRKASSPESAPAGKPGVSD